MLNSDPFAFARMLAPKQDEENGFGLQVPQPKGKPASGKPTGQPVAPMVEAPGTPVDIAAMHSYIAASPRHALPNLAPIPFIAQALLGRTSGMAAIPWFAQKVLGLGPPGTPIGGPAPAAAQAMPAAPAEGTPDESGLMPQPVDVAPLPPVQ